MLEGSQPRVWFVFVTKEGKSLTFVFVRNASLWKSCGGGVGVEETLVQVSLCVLKTLHELKESLLSSCLLSLWPSPSSAPLLLSPSLPLWRLDVVVIIIVTWRRVRLRPYIVILVREFSWILANPRESPLLPLEIQVPTPLPFLPPTPVKVSDYLIFQKRIVKNIHTYVWIYMYIRMHKKEGFKSWSFLNLLLKWLHFVSVISNSVLNSSLMLLLVSCYRDSVNPRCWCDTVDARRDTDGSQSGAREWCSL